MEKELIKITKKINKKTTIIIILAVIILLQVIARIYIGTKKEYFHMDEMYSYGLTNYNKLNINDNEDFYDNWHNKEYYQDYLEVNSNEVWDLSPVYENQKNDVHPPLYYLLLRMAETFTIDNFSKWTGITLNIILFSISSVLVYLVAKKIFKSKIFALVATVLNGFTLMSLESSIYIRMYELSNLSIIFLTFTQLLILDKKELKLVNCIPIIIALLIGAFTHYYFFIYALMIYIMYTVKCIREKNYKNLLKYNIAMVIAGVIFLAIFPYAINHIFFGYRGVGEGNGSDYFSKLFTFLGILDKNLGGYILILVPIALYFLTRKKEKINIRKINTNIEWIMLPLIAYFLIVTKNAPYIEIRYMIPIYSVSAIFIVYLIRQYLRQYYQSKQVLKITSIICVLIMVTPFLVGTKLDFTYSKFNNIAEKIEEKQLPIVYIQKRENNRFLDDLYLFTLVDKSIIIDSNNLEKFEQELDELGNYILICNDDEIRDEFLKDKNSTYLQGMNACQIYEIQK